MKERLNRLFVSLNLSLLCAFSMCTPLKAGVDQDGKTVRVFIFAGQSNMVGSDSKVKDIKRFPPFAGLEDPQETVLFSYSIGRENKMESKVNSHIRVITWQT